MAGHLHFDCFSGISGDMSLAALIDLGAPFELVRDALDSLALPGKIELEKTKRKGMAATRIVVHAEVENKHRHLHHIDKIIDAGKLTDGAKDLAKRIFRTMGQAEAEVHGSTIEKVHFHEVGAVDSIFDIVGVAVALDHWKPNRITASAVPTGSGWVDCEHGRMPVPAPATARLLVGIPIAASDIATELTTPTGAAILRTVVQEFTSNLPGRFDKIGCGAGTKEFPAIPNILRVFWSSSDSQGDAASDTVCKLETDLDDATGESIGYTMERLFAAGALDVHTTTIQMKKNRPGVTMTVLCEQEKTHELADILFRETGTFGIRTQQVQRMKLQRQAVEVQTPWGTARGKLGWNDSVKLVKPEFEDCARIARTANLPFREIHRAVQHALDDAFTNTKETPGGA